MRILNEYKKRFYNLYYNSISQYYLTSTSLYPRLETWKDEEMYPVASYGTDKARQGQRCLVRSFVKFTVVAVISDFPAEVLNNKPAKKTRPSNFLAAAVVIEFRLRNYRDVRNGFVKFYE